MAETYKVTQYVGADDKYEFTPSDGDAMWLVPHQVLLEGGDAPNATVTVNRREDGEAPREGEELVGEIIQGKHGFRFKKDQSGFSSNGSPRRDDATGLSIERQKAADIAMNGMVGLDFGFKREAFASDFKFMFQVVHGEITGEAGE